MNDPHVESLNYRLQTGEGLKFTDPPPLPHDEGRFACRLENGHLAVEMREHHTSVAAAREVVESFLDAWEIAETLNRGRREMWFEYANARMIDRTPPPPGASQVIRPMASDAVAVGVGPTVVRGERAYPPPPSGFVVSLDVRMLIARYERYTEGRELLAGTAYACLTYVTKNLANGDADAARKFNISRSVLDTLGRLAGGKGERKYPSQGPYTPQEEGWVAAAVRILIRRVGEHAAGSALKQITMADLPKLS